MTSQSIAALTAKALQTRWKLSARAGIPTAQATCDTRKLGIPILSGRGLTQRQIAGRECDQTFPSTLPHAWFSQAQSLALGRNPCPRTEKDTGLRCNRRGLAMTPRRPRRLSQQVPELEDSKDEKRRAGFKQKRETGASDAAQSHRAGQGRLIHFGPEWERRRFTPGWESRRSRNYDRSAMMAHSNDYRSTSAFRKRE
jgi:hypothetical protein